MTNTEQYWNDFAATQEEVVRGWQEQYDSDGELSTLELIERVMAREPEKQLAGIYNALGDSVFDLSDEGVREEMQADGFDDRAASEMCEAPLAAIPDSVRAEPDAPCDHQWTGSQSHETLERVGYCAKCGDEQGGD